MLDIMPALGWDGEKQASQDHFVRRLGAMLRLDSEKWTECATVEWLDGGGSGVGPWGRTVGRDGCAVLVDRGRCWWRWGRRCGDPLLRMERCNGLICAPRRFVWRPGS